MLQRKAMVSAIFLLTCGPAVVAEPPVQRPETVKPAASVDVAPIGEKSAYATPPQQTAPWSPPKTDLPADVVAAAKKLYEQGLADPRGCTYREIEIVLGDVWSGGGEAKKTRGFAFANEAYAVAWNGLVYRVKSVGPPADFRADVRAMLDVKHDRFPNTAEAWFVAQDSVTSLKAMLLLRLGEGELAKRVWDALEVRQDQDAYHVAAGDWLWSLFDRGVNAHMRGDVELTLETFRLLPPFAKLGDKQLAFLDDVEDILADDRRRASVRAPKMDDAAIAALASLPPSERIAKLIGALDQVAARQWGQPGGVALGEDPIVKALIAEGDGAVEPLLDAFENDTRRTKSVQFWRDFARHRSVIAVYEAAYVALSGLLDASFFQAVSTGDHLTARGVEGRREVGKKVRAYWSKWKGVPQEERFYRQLADDTATPDTWLTAASKITQHSNVQIMPTSNVAQYSVQTPLAPGQKPTLRGEPLRAKTSPTVTTLLAKRLAAMPDVRHACAMADAFAEWDPKAALPYLAQLQAATVQSFGASNEKHAAGMCIADLANERADAGDPAGLALYGGWVAKTTPHDVDYDVEHWFAPMVAHPTAPPIVAAATAMFRAPSPWGSDLVRHDLLKLDAFRAYVATKLADKSKVGTIHVTKTGVELKTSTYTSGQGMDAHDPLAPPEGTLMDLRVCDQWAAELAQNPSASQAPPFRVYWRQADRDRALAQVIAWVKTK